MYGYDAKSGVYFCSYSEFISCSIRVVYACTVTYTGMDFRLSDHAVTHMCLGLPVNGGPMPGTVEGGPWSMEAPHQAQLTESPLTMPGIQHVSRVSGVEPLLTTCDLYFHKMPASPPQRLLPCCSGFSPPSSVYVASW